MLSLRRMLKVNFDPLIVRLLREVKYFLLLGLRVPESALEVFERGEVRNHKLSYNFFISPKTTMRQLSLFNEGLCRRARRVGVWGQHQLTGATNNIWIRSRTCRFKTSPAFVGRPVITSFPNMDTFKAPLTHAQSWRTNPQPSHSQNLYLAHPLTGIASP